jgi:hypothetical protein
MRWRWAIYLAFILSWLLEPAAVYAQTPIPHDHCTCQTNMEVSAVYERAEAVFVGQVIELSRPNDAPLVVEWLNKVPGVYVPGYAYWRAYMAVSDSWKGMNTKAVTVLSSFGLNCGVSFTVGMDYMIYAIDSPVGWRTSTCAGTVELASAGPDLQYLAARPKLRLNWPLEWQAALGSALLVVVGLAWVGWRWLRRSLVSFER